MGGLAVFVKKLALNLGPRAVSVLGPAGYARLLAAFAVELPNIVKQRDLKPLDKRMGRRPIACRVDGHRFVFDAQFSDQHFDDGTYTFGVMRELYIRNCYLRDEASQLPKRLDAVVDLGANRGVFSMMMAPRANKVVAVEVLPEHVEGILHTAKLNGFDHIKVESAFIGAGGNYDARKTRTITMNELLDQHSIDRVSLLKMDIEGSEYDLFKHPEWLDRIDVLCMEIHPEWGRVQDVLDTLTAKGFKHTARTHTFAEVTDPQQAEFVYARRN